MSEIVSETAGLAGGRERFSSLQGGFAFLDAPGGTQVPQAVVAAMSDYLLHHNANTHWAYPTS